MKKEVIFDIDLSPKTRVSNKSPFLTLETIIKIPYAEQAKQYMPKKLVLVTYTDAEQPRNLDSKQLLKEINRENMTEIDLSESFVLLLSFKIEDGKVEMVVNHGSSKKKKKRKIDKNDLEEDTEDSTMEGDCKFHHYKRPCQFQTWGEMQEKEYYDHLEYQMVQKTFVDIKTHFVKNRNHKIFLEAELLVPSKLSEFFGMSRRRVGYRATELINYRFELESEIWCAELLQKQISKINFSMDNFKITSLKFSEEHFLKSFEQKRVVELITSLLKLEEVDLSEISLKQNANFFNHFFPTLYQKCYKLKKIVLQGPRQQWENTSVFQFLYMIPQRNWGAQIFVTSPGRDNHLERFISFDDFPQHALPLHFGPSPSSNGVNGSFQANINNNNINNNNNNINNNNNNQFQLIGDNVSVKSENPFSNQIIQQNLSNIKPPNFANNNINNNLNNNNNLNQGFPNSINAPFIFQGVPNNNNNNNQKNNPSNLSGQSTLLNNNNNFSVPTNPHNMNGSFNLSTSINPNLINSNNSINPNAINQNNQNNNNNNTINPNKINIIHKNDPLYPFHSKPFNNNNNNPQPFNQMMQNKQINMNSNFAPTPPQLFSNNLRNENNILNRNNPNNNNNPPSNNSTNQPHNAIPNVSKHSNNKHEEKMQDSSLFNSNGSLCLDSDDKLHSSSFFVDNAPITSSQILSAIIPKPDPIFGSQNDFLLDPFTSTNDFNFVDNNSKPLYQNNNNNNNYNMNDLDNYVDIENKKKQ